MNSTIEIKSEFIRYGNTIINRNSIAEAKIEQGTVLMQSGHEYHIHSKVLEHVFSDIVDYSAVDFNR